MSKMNITNLLEAILFTSGKSITIDEIEDKLPEYSSAEIMDAIRFLANKYSDSCGIHLIYIDNKIQFSTNPMYTEKVSSVLIKDREKELSATLLETLAIIAYNQPITRARLENIRARGCDYTIAKLLQFNLIDVVGRTENNAVLFGTTEEFLKRFQLHSLYDLPDRDSLMLRLNKLEEHFTLSGKDLYIDKTIDYQQANSDEINDIIERTLYKQSE